MVNQVKSFWRDSEGNEATSEFATTTSTTATIEAVLTAMQNLSDMELVEYQLTKEISPGPTGIGPQALDADHPYADDKSALIMEWSTANRKIRPKISIPGPSFKTPDDTVLYGNDLALLKTDVLVTTLITALTNYAVSAGGAALTILRRGYLDTRRGKRPAR